MDMQYIKNSVRRTDGDSGKGQYWGFFNLVAEDGHQFTKDELINIIKEIDYSISQVAKAEYNEIMEQTLTELEELEIFE